MDFLTLKKVADRIFLCTREKVVVTIGASKVIVQGQESVIEEIEKRLDDNSKHCVEFVVEIDV